MTMQILFNLFGSIIFALIHVFNRTKITISDRIMFAEIIIPLAFQKIIHGVFLKNFNNIVKPGIRAEVQLKNKRYSGIIKQIIKEKPKDFEPRPVINILDDEPLLYAQQLQLWQWIADYYMCSEGEVMQAAMPSNLKLSSETILFGTKSMMKILQILTTVNILLQKH